MGSLNTDGTRIDQSRVGTKNIGRAYTFSADGVEVEEVFIEGTSSIGTEANPTTSQYTTHANGRRINTVDEEGVIVESIAEALPDGDDIDQNPPWVGSSDGGGAASGLLLTEALILGSQDTNGIRLDIENGNLVVREGNDSNYGPVSAYSLGIWNGVTEGFRLTAATNQIYFKTDGGIQWGTSIAGGLDLGLARESLGVAKFTNGSTGLGALKALRHTEIITPAPSVTLAAASGQVVVVTGAGWREVKLPSAPVKGLHYDIKDGNGTASSGNIILNANGSTLDGSTSGVLDTNYESRTVIYNGSEWNNI